MIEKTLDITIKAGEMETFICHPERNVCFSTEEGPLSVLGYHIDFAFRTWGSVGPLSALIGTPSSR